LWASFIVSGDWRPMATRSPGVDKVAPGARGCACEQAGSGAPSAFGGGARAAAARTLIEVGRGLARSRGGRMGGSAWRRDRGRSRRRERVRAPGPRAFWGSRDLRRRGRDRRRGSRGRCGRAAVGRTA
jgi:hypothetical protein